MTLTPVLSTAGQIITPFLVLPRVEAKYRKRSNGKFETPTEFLHKINYMNIRSISSVDTNIFYD